jgi:hypothetical protein
MVTEGGIGCVLASGLIALVTRSRSAIWAEHAPIHHNGFSE